MEVFDNLLLYNPVIREWKPASFSVENGKIITISRPHALTAEKITDFSGARVIPGLIDSHIHIESTLLVPSEFGKLAASHGVTTVIADPHEIANVAGTDGVDFMIENSKKSPADIFFMVPSCVPATAIDVGGAVLTAEDIARYKNNPKVLGLGEMMNYPGVLAKDPSVLAKLSIFEHIDGHAPQLSGDALCEYISHGIRTEHECITADEAREKIELGMYILAREGGAAKNVAALSEVIDDSTESRCCFATDDKHADLIKKEGSIDNCIRVACRNGANLDLVLRCATLSAAECFGLNDRGIIAPGKIADFCVLDKSEEFSIAEVYKNGVNVKEFALSDTKELTKNFVSPKVVVRDYSADELALPEGKLKIIGLIKNEVATESLIGTKYDYGVSKVVCIDRYRTGDIAVGLVKGFGFKKGAIATSIAHDAHNIIAAGATDSEILEAVKAIADCGGGMSVVCGGKTTVLPLKIGGLMADLTCEELCGKLAELDAHLKETGAADNSFMHLSF
ncbi:MAG: adenine deaminase, partial [Methanocorpusculum sp.]|nr:adenine deaminase [Methanocorpusculum sp.]